MSSDDDARTMYAYLSDVHDRLLHKLHEDGRATSHELQAFVLDHGGRPVRVDSISCAEPNLMVFRSSVGGARVVIMQPPSHMNITYKIVDAASGTPATLGFAKC